jgi:hypothetical protein
VLLRQSRQTTQRQSGNHHCYSQQSLPVHKPILPLRIIKLMVTKTAGTATSTPGKHTAEVKYFQPDA